MFDPIKPYEEYQSNSFCKEIKCNELDKRLSKQPNECKDCKAYEFHDHLNRNGFHILRNTVEISENYLPQIG